LNRRTTLLALIICTTAVCAITAAYSTKLVISNSVSLAPTIIIDAGHGGFDGGAVAEDKTVEKDINLTIAKKLCDISELSGFNVIMVRDGDFAVCDKGLDTLRSKKVSDIHNRLDLTKKYPDAIFLSIHQNHFEESKYWGAQVFYGAKNPDSKLLAEYLQKALTENIQKDNKRQIKKAEKNLYILYNTDSIAVMAECGFLSNPEERSKLKEPEYCQAVAFEILRGVTEFILFSESGNNIVL